MLYVCRGREKERERERESRLWPASGSTEVRSVGTLDFFLEMVAKRPTTHTCFAFTRWILQVTFTRWIQERRELAKLDVWHKPTKDALWLGLIGADFSCQDTCHGGDRVHTVWQFRSVFNSIHCYVGFEWFIVDYIFPCIGNQGQTGQMLVFFAATILIGIWALGPHLKTLLGCRVSWRRRTFYPNASQKDLTLELLLSMCILGKYLGGFCIDGCIMPVKTSLICSYLQHVPSKRLQQENRNCHYNDSC